MHDLTALHKEFAARGFTTKRTGRALTELAAHLTMSFGGTALFIYVDNLAVKLLGLFIMSCGNLGITTSTHTSSHNATSRKLWVNKALTFFGYPLMFGASATYWWNKHIAVHHPTPNVIGLDDDIDLLPWFALTEEDFNSGGRLKRWYHRHQWLLVPLAIALNTFNLLQTATRYMLNALRDPERRSRLHWIDLCTVTMHFVLFIGVPMLFFAPLHVIGFYVLRTSLMGYAMFAGFAPAHFPAEAWFLPTEGHPDKSVFKQHTDYVLVQTVTTVNFKTGWFGRLLCSGVDYQIEHHLFPGIPHMYYPQVSPILKKYCDERGYPYRTLGWWEACWKSVLAFKHPRPVAATVESSRAAFTAAPAMEESVSSPIGRTSSPLPMPAGASGD